MQKYILFYAFAILFIFIQVFLSFFLNWFPDIVLTFVVFAGVFLGYVDGLYAGLFVGFFRGCFFADMFLCDTIIFSVIGVVSSLLARRFYWQNFFVQMILVLVMSIMLALSHLVYLNIISENNVDVFSAIFANRGNLLITMFTSPFVFLFLKRLFGLKE